MKASLAQLDSFPVTPPTAEALAAGLFGEFSNEAPSTGALQAMTVEHGRRIIDLLIEQRILQWRLEHGRDPQKNENERREKLQNTLHGLQQIFNGCITAYEDAFGDEPAASLAELAHEVADNAPLRLPAIQPTLF